MATATASSYGESTSVFEARLQASGIPDEDAKKIKAHISTLKQLAFVSSFTPAQADEKPLMDELEAMLGRRPETGVKASFRALFHESYAVVTSEMRQRVERSEEVQVRRLSQPERAERYNKQVSKLKGITIKGPSEPSETLVDLAVGAYEANELRYIPWDRCTSREQEVSSEKKREIKLTLDEPSGKLKVDSKTPEEVADTSSEILVLQALQRRALAMDQANLLDYEKGDMWAQRLLRARMIDPPPLFARPSWKQLMEADRKLFSELRDRTRSGVQADTSGRPLDRNIVAVMESYDVSCLLQPVPTAASKLSLRIMGQRGPILMGVQLPAVARAAVVKARARARAMLNCPKASRDADLRPTAESRSVLPTIWVTVQIQCPTGDALRVCAYVRCRSVGLTPMEQARAPKGRPND